MPLANSLESLMPERSSPGQNSPHGPAPAPLCGPRRGEGRDQAAGTSQPSPVTPKPTAGPGTAGAAGDQRRPSFYAPRLPGFRVRNTWGPLFSSNTHPDHHHHFLQTLPAHWSKRKGTCKGKKVLCPLPQVRVSSLGPVCHQLGELDLRKEATHAPPPSLPFPVLKAALGLSLSRPPQSSPLPGPHPPPAAPQPHWLSWRSSRLASLPAPPL